MNIYSLRYIIPIRPTVCSLTENSIKVYKWKILEMSIIQYNTVHTRGGAFFLPFSSPIRILPIISPSFPHFLSQNQIPFLFSFLFFHFTSHTLSFLLPALHFPSHSHSFFLTSRPLLIFFLTYPPTIITLTSPSISFSYPHFPSVPCF